MSKTFQIITEKNVRITVAAQHVSHVIEQGDLTLIHLNSGVTLTTTKNSYRSVRGYLNKALSGKSEEAVE